MWPRGLFSLGEFMNNFNAQIKPALTFNQQLDHLINDKGLIVNNYDNALSILKHENYYRLSGYMIDFLDKSDNFIDNISFEDIYNVYKTDKEIRSTGDQQKPGRGETLRRMRGRVYAEVQPGQILPGLRGADAPEERSRTAEEQIPPVYAFRPVKPQP